jgi:hypothetical protein
VKKLFFFSLSNSYVGWGNEREDLSDKKSRQGLGV